MPQVIIPPAIRNRITEITHESWSPGKIVHRLRDGSVNELVRARTRFRGTFTVGHYSSEGERIDLGAVEAFATQMLPTDNWCFLPWGGDEPYYDDASLDGVRFEGTITNMNLSRTVLTLSRTSSNGQIRVGSWLQLRDDFGHIVTSVSGTDSAPTITMQPGFPVIDVGDVVQGMNVMPIRMGDPSEVGISISRRRGFSGGFTMVWEQYLGSRV